jgi:Zn-dependent protease with chaperone function
MPEQPSNTQFFDMVVERAPQAPVAPETVSTQYYPPPLPAKRDPLQPPAINATSDPTAQQSPIAPPEEPKPEPSSPSITADPQPNNKIHAPLVQGAYYTQAESSTPQEMPPLPIPSKGALPPEPGTPEAASERGGSTPKRRLPRAFGIDETEGSYDDLVSQTKNPQQVLLGIDDLVHPREKFYGTVSSIIGWLCLGLSFLFLFGLVIAPVALVAAWISGGICKGHLRAHSIKISENQFPEVHEIIQEYSEKLGIKPPQVYVCHYDGVLNAFTNRFQQRDYITISSDVFEMAYQQGLKEIAFVICHELAHVKRGHVKWAWLHTPASFIPFFGSAYSRSCEYTCDRIARYLVPDGALFGLVALAAGTKLYKHVNLKALYQQQEAEWDFWTWFTEIESSHPNLLNRIRAIGLASERDSA